jgi:hypothetical protein
VRSSIRIALVSLVVGLVASPEPAQAWNPFRAAVRKLESAAGSFVEAATTPLIRNAELAGRRVLSEADAAIGRNLDRAETITTRLVAESDRLVADSLAKIDRSVEARIVQVTTIADGLIDESFGRLDRAIGRIDAIARTRIEQVRRVAGDLITRADQTAIKLLERGDAILGRRLEEVRAVVETSIEAVDRIAEARIEQLDELAARGIGTLDVLGTKQSLALESTVLRVAALLGLVGFLGFVLWRLFVEVTTQWNAVLAAPTRTRMRRVLVRGLPRFAIQLVLAAAGAGGLYLLSGWLPTGARDRAAQQVADHERALHAAFDAYDFRAVRYELAQLEVLRPPSLPAARAVARKSALFERVFLRPGALQSLQGVREIMHETLEVERLVGPDDPDLLVVQAFVLWQVGSTRHDELEAAALCARALRVAARPGTRFHLAGLARNYVTAFLHDPYEVAGGNGLTEALATVRAIAADAPPPAGGDAEDTRFQHVITFNTLLAELDAASSHGFAAMIAAHAEVVVAARGRKRGQPEPTAAAAARDRRTAAAGEVIAAWQRFDEQVAASPWLADDPIVLNVFTLNDVVLSHALYFQLRPETAELPGAFLGPAAAAIADPRLRLQIAPIRVAWARRYAEMLGPNARELVAFEESRRFGELEETTRAYEAAYVDFIAATRAPAVPAAALTGKARTAITAAARLGLYRTEGGRRVLEAAHLVGLYRTASGHAPEPELVALVAEAHERRRLRFL